MEYVSTKRIESTSCEGVAFTIRKMTVRRRAELEEMQATIRERLRWVQSTMAPLSKEYRAAVEAAKAAVKPARDKLVAEGMGREDAEKEIPLPAVDFGEDKLKRLVEESEMARKIDREELTPKAVEYALVGIEGLTIDGEAATFEALLERGPDPLYEEIAQAVARELGLLPEERENLSSPSTSDAEVDGSAKAGNAITAARVATTYGAGARSITVLASASAGTTG